MDKISFKNGLNARNTDPVRLISAIKRHPAIWNSRCPEYKIKKNKEHAWNEVASVIVNGWKDYNQTERETTLHLLIKRWNNIRDYHVKSMKVQRRKKYAFSEYLTFLQPELENKLRFQLMSQADDCKIEAIDDEIEVLEENLLDEEVEEQIKEEYVTIVDTLDNNLEDSNHDTRQETLRYDNVPEGKEDPDLMFLKSLLPDVKKLDGEEKFAFKYAIMQAYMDILKKRYNS